MLISHRVHSVPFGGAHLECHRAIAPAFLVRRVVSRELVQDERFTKHLLGVDYEVDRNRLVIVLDGTIDDFVDDRRVRLGPGDACYVPAGTPYATRSRDADTLELEWDEGALDDGSFASADARFRVGERTCARARDVATELRRAVDAASMRAPLVALIEGLDAEGISLVPDRIRAMPLARPGDQDVMNGVDAALSALDGGPMLVDIEDALPLARRTLTRRVRSVHERHALLGRGGGAWRGIRDFYRLVIASMLVSHVEATPRRVAGLVGYRSTEALDHAFRRASLPAPIELGRLTLRAG